MTECCTPLLGRDILNSQNLSDFLPPTSTKSLIPIMTLLIKRGVAEIDIDINQVLNPQVWATRTPGRAHRAKLAMIRLKDSKRFPNKRQYCTNLGSKGRPAKGYYNIPWSWRPWLKLLLWVCQTLETFAIVCYWEAEYCLRGPDTGWGGPAKRSTGYFSKELGYSSQGLAPLSQGSHSSGLALRGSF